MAGAIAIDQGTKSVETTIKKKLGSLATVTEDYEKFWKENEDNEDADLNMPKPETLDEIGALEQVNYYDYSIRGGIQTKNFKAAQAEDGSVMFGDEENGYYINFKGVNYNEVLDIKNNIIKLTDGRVFEKEEVEKGKNVILISEELAKANDVRVGDKVTIDYIINNGIIYKDDGTTEETEVIKKDFQMEVIGIYNVIQSEKKEKKDNNNGGMDQESNYLERANSIYAPNDYVSSVTKEGLTLSYEKNPDDFDMNKDEFEEMLNNYNYATATYTLKSPEVAEDFRIQAEKILKDNKNTYSKVLISSDQYNQVAGPVKGMSKISKLVIIISVLASVLIITLVTILFLRDRKHELGIYLSLGEKRTKVIGQIVFEVVVVAFVAITISVFTGNLLAKSFSSSLIQSQKTEETSDMYANYSQDDWTLSQLSNNTVSEDDVIEAYQISLNPTYIILFYVVGIGVVLVSSVVPLIYIMRLNPKKIMM